MNPGVYDDLSNDEYHSGPGISKSGLDIVHRSPAHFKAAKDARAKGVERRSTAAQVIGTAFHCLLLEPHLFADLYAAPFQPDPLALDTTDDIREALKAYGLKTSGAKAEITERLREVAPETVFLSDLRAAYEAENEGKTILPADDVARLVDMTNAVMAHDAARKLLSAKGKAEQSIYWTDPETGLLCRIRPDWLREDLIVVDVKTTDDASPEGFARSVVKYRYYVQDALYRDGVEAAFGRPARGFVFLAVEKEPPHVVAVYVLGADAVEAGRLEYRTDLADLATAEASGEWPGYGAPTIQTLSLPAWFYTSRNL